MWTEAGKLRMELEILREKLAVAENELRRIRADSAAVLVKVGRMPEVGDTVWTRQVDNSHRIWPWEGDEVTSTWNDQFSTRKRLPQRSSMLWPPKAGSLYSSASWMQSCTDNTN
jgi:hypothetical protein